MRRDATLKRLGRWSLTLGMVIAALLTPIVAPSVRAQVAAGDEVASAAVGDSQGVDPPAEVDRWWGAAGAILCGTEIRLVRVVPAIGLNPYVLAAGVGGCILAAMDVFTT
jgi:hypothetical protein